MRMLLSLCVVGLFSFVTVETRAGVIHGDILAPGSPASGDFVLATQTPGKWGPAADGTGATVTWSLMGSGLTTDVGAGTSVAVSTFMPAGFKAELIAAFAQWSAVADITFVEVADPGVGWQAAGAGAADIRIAGHTFDGPGSVLAHGFFPPSNGGAAAGDIHFDSADTWVIGFPGAGFDIQQVMAHEIGHAIGLRHTGVSGSLMNPSYTEAFMGVQADDIAGAVFIYGAAPATAIPEPSSMALLATGAIGLMGYRRRKRKLAA